MHHAFLELIPNRPTCGSTWSATSGYYDTERAQTGRWTKGRTPNEILGKATLWHKKR